MTNLIGIGLAKNDEGIVRECAERLLELRPDSPAALEGLAASAFASLDYQTAAAYCAKLVESSPAQYERWFNLGVAYQRTQRIDEAIDAYTEAIRLRKDAKQAYVNLGVAHQEKGDLKRAR